jgi:HSP20 family protein
MSVIKIHILGERDRLQERFRSMADDLFRMTQPSTKCRCEWIPAVDLYEADGSLFMVAALGGVDMESIELTLNSSYLRLSGNRKSPAGVERGKQYFQMEIEYGPFERIIRLPFSVDPEKVQVNYANGMLVTRMYRLPRG